MTAISASVLLDSVSPTGDRLTTMEITLPRCVLAEFNTHRQFSRNFASSRAIPVSRMIEKVVREPFVPLSWGANQGGMRAGDEHYATVCIATEDGLGNLELDREAAWLHARDSMVKVAFGYAEAGYHKQLVNRLLEPWMFAHGVVTSTEWANFFSLRCHVDAEPHMRALAETIRAAMEQSTPKLLRPGEWHLPFIDREAADRLDTAIRCSVAKCARVSYLNHDRTPSTVEQDLALYERLVGARPMHASPAEHQATPDDPDDPRPDLWGNLRGWRQYRKTLFGECVHDH